VFLRRRLDNLHRRTHGTAIARLIGSQAPSRKKYLLKVTIHGVIAPPPGASIDGRWQGHGEFDALAVYLFEK
jgi:hypothetical protein